MLSSLYIAAAAVTGAFCGVSADRILETPILRLEQVWGADAARIVQLGTNVEAGTDADGVACARTAKGFALHIECDLPAGTYRLEAVAWAPGKGSDSLHVDLSGQRLPAPLYLPTGGVGTVSAGFRITAPGPHTLDVTLREGPGCTLRSLRLCRLTVAPAVPPVRPELARCHPRLLITPDRVAALRARAADPRLANVYCLPAPLSATAPPYVPGRRNGGAYRTLGDHALRYLLEPDPGQLAALLGWLETAAAYGDVGVDLDAEYFAEGVALTYDWLHEAIPPALRDRVRDRLAALCEQLFAASVAGRTGGSRSFQQNHYWYAHLALALAAGALVGEHPDAETWLAWAWDRFERVALTFGPDGAFHEGPGYWDFSMPALYLFTDLYESLTGLRVPAMDAGLRGQAEFRVRHLLPGLTATAPLEDTKIGHGRPAAATLCWEAARFRDPVAQGFPAALGMGPSSSRFALLWFDPDLAAEAAPLQGLALARRYPDVETVFARTSWEPEATFAAFVCRPLGGHSYAELCARHGIGGTGHNHPAQGHFYLASGKAVLAGDTGYTYRKTTRDHNTILVDGRGQYGDGEMWPSPKPGRPHITAFAAEGSLAIVVADVTDAYPPEAGLKRFQRTFVLAGPELAVVFDQLAGDGPRTFSWLLHHWGSLSAEGPDQIVTAEDRRLRVQPMLPEAAQVVAETYRPEYIHPTRDLTPATPDVNLLELRSAPAAETAFLVPMVIGKPGAQPPRAQRVSCEGGVGVRLGETTVWFRNTPDTMTFPGPGGAPRTTRAAAAVTGRVEGRPILLEAGGT